MAQLETLSHPQFIKNPNFGGVVALKILVSAQGPLVLGFGVWSLGFWGLGLTILLFTEGNIQVLGDYFV